MTKVTKFETNVDILAVLYVFQQTQHSSSPIILKPFYCVTIAATELCELVLQKIVLKVSHSFLIQNITFYLFPLPGADYLGKYPISQISNVSHHLKICMGRKKYFVEYLHCQRYHSATKSLDARLAIANGEFQLNQKKKNKHKISQSLKFMEMVLGPTIS